MERTLESLIENATLVRIQDLPILRNTYIIVLAIPKENLRSAIAYIGKKATLIFDDFRGEATLTSVEQEEDNPSCHLLFRSLGRPDAMDRSQVDTWDQ